MKRQKLNFYLAGSVFLVTFLLYLPALQNDFVEWDDQTYVYENPNIRKLNPALLKWAFSSFSASNWHPLTWLSHAVDYAIWGLNPVGHHLTNIVLHAANTFLVVLLAIRLIEIFRGKAAQRGFPESFPDDRSILIVAAITGLLFGLHPIHVESVAWVAERKDVLCALFFLGSIMAYLKYATAADNSQMKNNILLRLGHPQYLLALGLFALALLSKPMAVTLPLVLLILDWHPFARIHGLRGSGRLLVEKLPFLSLSLALSLITLSAQSSGNAVMPLIALPYSERIIMAMKAPIAYLENMILPLNLIALYPYPLSIKLLSFRYLLPILLVIGITVAAAVIAKKQSVWLAIWSYYLVSLLPVLGIFQVGSQSMADRYTYLPSLGPFFAAGLLAAWIFSQFEQAQQRTTLKRISFAAAATVILCLSSLTVKQIGIWKNSITLWDRVIEKEPNQSYIAYANRGKAFEKIGQSDRAIEDFTAAISLNPMNHVAFYERAISYEHKGLSGKAIEDYNRVISLTPDNVIAYLNRGMLFEKNALMKKALEDYDMAISLDPMNYEALNTRGVYYINNGFFEKAFTDFSSAISINSGYEDAYNNRGVALEKLGQLDEAIADYTAAISLNPLDYSAFNNRGLVYHRQGASDKALEDFCRAIAINQNYGLAYHNRGYVYLKMGKPGLAGADFEKACAFGNQDGCKALKEMSKRFPLSSRYS